MPRGGDNDFKFSELIQKNNKFNRQLREQLNIPLSNKHHLLQQQHDTVQQWPEMQQRHPEPAQDRSAFDRKTTIKYNQHFNAQSYNS
mmetsp:Transcript_3867/g.6573  ORF Transcript_3867/g.6573 Transcript_3867/m.6573 type:complete len:87 (-) Transcript_3867:68-328(-)